MNRRNIELFTLSDSFYQAYPIQKYDQILAPKKNGRGHYGMVFIELYSLEFAIPLHSNIRNGYTIRQDNITGHKSGLDFEKAVVIESEKYKGSAYKVSPANDYNAISKKRNHIEKMFKNYVHKYIKAVNKNDKNVLDRNYKFTTLKYFHDYLFRKSHRACLLNPLLTQINYLNDHE